MRIPRCSVTVTVTAATPHLGACGFWLDVAYFLVNIVREREDIVRERTQQLAEVSKYL